MSKLTCTLLQANLFWEDKTANLSMLEEKINGLNQTELVILPEMFSTGFSMRPNLLAETMQGSTVEWMRRLSHQKKIILTGSLIIEENKHYFNRLIWMLPNGQMGVYDKRHLFAYGKEDEHYRPGDKRLITSVNGWKVNLQVCYDLRFPVWSRQSPTETGEPEYDLLIYVANWPERRNIAWKTLLRARAIENQSFVIGVNRVGKDGNDIYHSGDSMVVDPLGEMLYHKEHEEDEFTISLDKEKLLQVRKTLPFLRDADDFSINL